MRRQRTFLLKIWNDGESSETWRASLEDVRTQERRQFADLRHLAEFIGVGSLLEADPNEEQP